MNYRKGIIKFIGRKIALRERFVMEEFMGAGNNHQNKKASQIRAVILDYGEVLCQRPKMEALQGMARVFGIDPGKFIALYGGSRDPYDRGVMTAEQYWREFARRAEAEVDEEVIQQLRRLDTEMWSTTSPEMTEWVGMLKESGLTTALLSNMQHDMAAYARKNFDWLRGIDHQILSCEVGLVKPDAAIFHHCIERVGVRPEEALFVDDREANVNSARAIGIRAIHFKTTEQLRDELQQIGFEVVPPEAQRAEPL
jgi:putative hydrolase of the HAD superfamily